MRLALHQEQVSPTGSMMSVGILNQLGRPNLEILTVLVREAVQNSWDARASASTPVLFGIKGWTLSDSEKHHLTHSVFSETPPSSSLPLLSLIHNAETVEVLVLYDRGTVGLSGSTRADKVTEDGEESHFVNFLRNVGQPSDKAFTGGTYGYGKAAFYRASRVKTICVYTRTWFRGRLETRFIAAALGEPYSEDGIRCTGRHWWGVRAADHNLIVDPLLNNAADEMATAIGMPLFEGDECGTNIMVLQPLFDERTPLQAVSLMAESMLWYFWPKLLTQETGYPAMHVQAAWQGHRIDIPAPEVYPPLKGFVEAMYRVKSAVLTEEGSFRFNLHSLSTARPKQTLGQFALQEFPLNTKSVFDTGDLPGASSFATLTHHTALMRQPELVVKYLAGVPLADSSKGYAGVFVCDKEVDAVFADAEPPTHDDWVSSSLEERNHRIFVNQALKQIQQGMDSFASQGDVRDSATATFPPLGAVARRLGRMLLKGNEPAIAQVVPNNPKNSTNASRASRTVSDTDSPKLPPLIPIMLSGPVNEEMNASWSNIEAAEMLDTRENFVLNASGMTANGAAPKLIGRSQINYLSRRLITTEDNTRAVKVEFWVEHAQHSSGTVIQVNANVMLDGNAREAEPPIGQPRPSVIYWADPANNRYPGSQALFIPAQLIEPCSVVVSVPGTVMLLIELIAVAQGFE
ncbi:MAG: hypothetical protein OHK0046_36900 [Anaerolineae bacterium]